MTSDPTKPLCVFEVNGKPCGRSKQSWVHDTRKFAAYGKGHPYTPPAETGRHICKPSCHNPCMILEDEDNAEWMAKHRAAELAAPVSPEPPLNVRLKGDKDKGRFCIHGVELIKWCKICDEAGTVSPEPPHDEIMIDDSPEEVAATAYQILGVMSAPVRVLDYFAAIAHGDRPENILPFSPDELLLEPEREAGTVGATPDWERMYRDLSASYVKICAAVGPMDEFDEVDTVVERIRELRSSLPSPAPQWIPVKERLPKPMTDVLLHVVRLERGKLAHEWVQIASLRNDGQWIDDDSTIGYRERKKPPIDGKYPKHWMPLPAVPNASVAASPVQPVGSAEKGK